MRRARRRRGGRCGRETRDERREAARAILERIGSELSDSERALFRALFIEERPAADVGRELGITAAAVRQRLYRLRRRIDGRRYGDLF